MFRQMHASTLQNRHLQPGVAVLIMANTAYVVLWPPLPRQRGLWLLPALRRFFGIVTCLFLIFQISSAASRAKGGKFCRHFEDRILHFLQMYSPRFLCHVFDTTSICSERFRNLEFVERVGLGDLKVWLRFAFD